ncbi:MULTISPECIES: large-conductance mechanosensitive channel protein MscL [unclassified Corynebacterium]|uniref:large-conductance mechanosensitive channel protein MscL n=1 Tax=unclassified Corynebacterium TaxID=2624378 RepID=UPI0026548113|nr:MULTISPECIES: large-conductance mechanosensitive channel protein MscL [unclassified Corynebacterium]MDN8594854.1 large-conductance mechanosensitive channel protein MscL [Corynebacterium sp. P4_F2]WKK56500.1 large-conductance mechanosensitive channel protein MscL [Corynebacterium sp. P4-C1]WKK63935.1 large-conductance mechanosensitive channel protein MscL [Corynebacterium sp. P8-C1]
MLKGFKDFIMRGNVIDLAVGVVIGAAFTAIVTAFTDNIINPLINSVGGADFSFGFKIISGDESTFIDFGALVTAIINFLLIAAVVYFLIVAPMNKLDEQQKLRKGIDPKATDPTEQELLTEIRDLLAGGNNPQIKH